MKDWRSQEARSRFSALLDAALSEGPQRVTRRGAPAVVVLAVKDYERLRALEHGATPSLPELLLAIPQDDGEFERIPVKPRSFCG